MRFQEQEMQQPIGNGAISTPLALVDESGLTPEPEKMGDKVPYML